MAIDSHIKFEGVDGESAHADHKGEIDVLSWAWGVSNGANITGGGSGKGKAVPGSLSFVHLYDKASPILAKKCAQGVHFPTVTLTAAKSGDGQKDFLKVVLKEVYIESVQPAGSSGGDIVESVALSYASIEFGYKPQDAKGALGGEVKFTWDVKASKVS